MEDNLSNREHELKLVPTVHSQVKLLHLVRSRNVKEIIQTLTSAFGIGDFRVAVENITSIIDEYFDTDDLAIFQTHSVFRVRRDGGGPKLVIKRLISQEPGEFTRTEHETSLTEERYQEYVANGFSTFEGLQIVDLTGKKLSLKLKVSNERSNYLLQRDDERLRLSLDSFMFSNPKTGRTSDQQFEIELEALNDVASSKLRNIKNNLLGVLRGFEFSKSSKYERGIKKFSIDRSEWLQGLIAWGSSESATWAGIVIGMIGVFLTILGILLTIRAK